MTLNFLEPIKWTVPKIKTMNGLFQGRSYDTALFKTGG
jgi:hypothetical protein